MRVMTAVFLALPFLLFAAYFYVRSVNRRGVAGTHDRITDVLFGDPQALRFGGPLPDSSIDYAKKEHHS